MAEAPKPPGPIESPSGGRRVTTGERRAITAERPAVLPPEPKQKLSADVVKATAVETLLNSFGILRDLAGDFQRQEKFLKYKVLVLVCWLGLSTTSAIVGCPASGAANEIHARLVKAGDASRPVYMVKNDAADKWTDVEVVVNGKYRTTAAEIASDGDLTIVPRLLVDSSGGAAPPDLKIFDIDVRSAEGDAVLMRGGQVLK